METNTAEKGCPCSFSVFIIRIGDMKDKYAFLIDKRYEEFKHTLEQCGVFLLNLSDKKIEYHIFEEFDISARTLLYKDTLETFLDEGIIDDTIKEKCLWLRERFVNIEPNKPELWNVESVRNSKEWREILELSDEIKELLYV